MINHPSSSFRPRLPWLSAVQAAGSRVLRRRLGVRGSRAAGGPGPAQFRADSAHWRVPSQQHWPRRVPSHTARQSNPSHGHLDHHMTHRQGESAWPPQCAVRGPPGARAGRPIRPAGRGPSQGLRPSRAAARRRRRRRWRRNTGGLLGL